MIVEAVSEREPEGVSLAGVVLSGMVELDGFWDWCGDEVIEELWECLGEGDPLVVEYALDALGRLGMPNYEFRRNTYLSCLNAEEANVRQTAIGSSTVEIVRTEVAAFLTFANDMHVAEVSMGQPWRFVLRDFALERLSIAFSLDLAVHENFEYKEPYGQVYYWDWDSVIKRLK